MSEIKRKRKRKRPEFVSFEFEDGTSFKLPLAGGLNAELNARLFEAACVEDAVRGEAAMQRLILDIFKAYNDAEDVSGLSMSELMGMWADWRAASAKAGQEPGE